MEGLLERHPERGRRGPEQKRAVFRLVVNRAGSVSYVEVEQATGDAYLDAALPEVASRLRFLPARLDDMPFDVRFRYTMDIILK